MNPPRDAKPGNTGFSGRVLELSDRVATLANAGRVLRVELSAEDARRLDVGDWVRIHSRQDGPERQVASIEAHVPARSPRGDGEFARVTLSGLGQRLAHRAQALRVVRTFFDTRQFVEVDAPLRVTTPGLDVHVEALKAGEQWLTTSPEFFHKRLVAGGMQRIYQLGHCIRADEAGPWHEPEFMMLEWYRAFQGIESIMGDTEQLVRDVCAALGNREELVHGSRRIDLSRRFERLTVREAFRRHAGIRDAAELALNDEARYFEILVDQVEPALAGYDVPVFLHDYPASQASLARLCPTDPEVAERFELYIAGIELCNGFGELTDAVEQRSRFLKDQRRRQELERPVYPLDERFLGALEDGLPPCAGNALGFDRLLALVLNQANIQSVLPFPDDQR